MAAPWWRAVLCGRRAWRGFGSSAALSRPTPPLGPMGNADIDVSNLEQLEKYRSFYRYPRWAEQEARTPHCWRTYWEHFGDKTDPKDTIDIGLPPPTVCRTQQLQERKQVLRELRTNVEEERAARLRTASIPLEAVQAEWERTCGPYDNQRLAEYYGLYRDLFHGATFVPWVPLHVAYAVGEEDLMPVYHGNEVTPTETAQAPEVTYEADEGSMWTLLLTNLDGHLLEPDAEYVHWLLTNIPGNRVTDGQETCPYLPTFPARGTGFHRFTFLLFKQDKTIDFSEDTRLSPCYQLAQRTFHTFDFYKKHQDAMISAGLAFFQCCWDDSVTQTFHQLLDMREPVFEFVRPPPYHPKQKHFPHRQSLRYLDRYRDSHEPTYGIY
ncbi:39S ribosomal protein L38, mitochondrial [Sciurus carolinensis]|uniref:Large ribosomal subunit protein mL38 n=1 Tax=Sciurus carolinensis TaxID=30640 RepID=A0AA41SRK6_SCICA|nr:39S ribosomal protein L38, mitochondrial [Sciurus carolinensis]